MTESAVRELTKTVYSWVMPETERMHHEIATDPQHRRALIQRERRAWTKKQDAMHLSFADRWLRWVGEEVDLPEDLTDDFEAHGTPPDAPWQFYPTAGSSEAIRASLYELAQLSAYRPHLGPPTIHVLEGEYEGYEALARPMGIRVVKHPGGQRFAKSFEPYKGEAGRGHAFYISSPSSRDGAPISRRFLEHFKDSPVKLRVDLCYVGCVAPLRLLRVSVPDFADMIFFSLSKVFGLYYRRVGGVFSRESMPGLWGNRWFKNLHSLYLGERLLERYGVDELPLRYKELQQHVVGSLEEGAEVYTAPLSASPVLLLATSHNRPHVRGMDPAYFDQFYRARGRYRYCLTPLLYAEAQRRGLYDEGA